MKIISFLYKLLFDTKRQPKLKNQEELFHSDDYLRPDKINYKQCPKCKNEAKTNKEVVNLFGRMTVNGKPYIQSWCKNCRKDTEKPIFHKDSQQNLIEEND
tara:strand:+ start:266 stop:568 length:303 start_codon:yes stop_codon:yes gene_type:complete